MVHSEEEGKFEKVLAECGNAGRYQGLLFWLFLAPLNFIISWIALGPILISAVPAHWCDVPGRPSEMDVETWINLTVPRTEDGSLEQCSQYQRDNVTLQFTSQIIKCGGSFSYSAAEYDTTLASHHNWVCDNSGEVANWLSVGLVGNIAGTLILNPLSDMFGRRAIFVVTALFHLLGGVARVYVEPYWLVMLTQFLASMSFPAILEISLILVYELVTSRWRSRVTASSFVSWSLGTCLLALLAYVSRSHQILSLVTSLPFLVYLFAYKLIPESPRWLISRGRIEEAEKLMTEVARINKREQPPFLYEKLKDISLNKEPHYGIIQLLQKPRMRGRTILLAACYMFNNLFFYGIVYNTVNMVGNDFLNFFLLGLSEIPSNLFGWWASLNIGRRWTQTWSFFLAAIFTSLMLAAGEHSEPWVNITLMTISKFFITTSFQVIYLQTGELFPTTHCATGVGFASLVSSSVGVSAPYIAFSGKKAWWLPYIILTSLGFLGFVISSFVPETLGTSLPQSLVEAENFLVGESFWSYKGRKFWRCGKSSPISAKVGSSSYGRSSAKEPTIRGVSNPALTPD